MTRAERKARQDRALAAMRELEAKHPRCETWMGRARFQYPGPLWAWDDLQDNWWTAAEWLARWRRLPPSQRRHRRCPPRYWIMPARITLRGGRRVRKLP